MSPICHSVVYTVYEVRRLRNRIFMPGKRSDGLSFPSSCTSDYHIGMVGPNLVSAQLTYSR